MCFKWILMIQFDLNRNKWKQFVSYGKIYT